MSLENEYNVWTIKNLAFARAIAYTPYLKRMGSDLEEFMNLTDYKVNFFEYDTYEEYKNIYQSITGESDESISQIIKGSNEDYPVEIEDKFNEAKKKLAQKEFDEGSRSKADNLAGLVSYGDVLRSYVKFLYYHENDTETYPKSKEAKEKKDKNPTEKNESLW